MASSISLFEIVDIATSNPKNFFWKALSVVDAAAVNSNYIKVLLSNGLEIFY